MNVRVHSFSIYALGAALLGPSSLGLAQAARSTEAPRSSIAYAGDELAFTSTTEDVEHSLHRATKKVRRAGVGLGLSLAAVPVGAALITKGMQRSVAASADDGDAMLLAGMVTAIGGLVGVVASGAVLAPARRDKRRLQMALAPTTLRLGPGSVAIAHRF